MRLLALWALIILYSPDCIGDMSDEKEPLSDAEIETLSDAAKAKIPLAPVDKKWKYRLDVYMGRYRSKGVRPNQRHLYSIELPCQGDHIVRQSCRMPYV